MHLYFSLYGQQLCVSAQAFTIHVKVARFQIRRLSRRHLLFPPSKSVGIFFMIVHLSTLMISSFTSSVGFRQKEACCEKQEALPATAAPRQGTAQPFVSLLYGGTFAAPPFLSASIVSADAHHGKCANENLPKSEYGSLLKGCRRSTNWNLSLSDSFGIKDFFCVKRRL